MIEDQIGERSLAKQQERLEEEAVAEAEATSGEEEDGDRSGSESGSGEGRAKALLRADDEELERLDGVSPVFLLVLNFAARLVSEWLSPWRAGSDATEPSDPPPFPLSSADTSRDSSRILRCSRPAKGSTG